MEVQDQRTGTLAKACDRCIKAKRKCSRNLPQCLRCAKQRIACRYRNQPLGQKDLHRNSLTPQLDTNVITTQHIQYYPQLGRRENGYYLPSCLQPGISEVNGLRLDPPDIVLTIDQPTLTYLLAYLRKLPEIFMHTSGTVFIHPQTYGKSQPPLLQMMCDLCHMQTHARTYGTDRDSLSIALKHVNEVLGPSLATMHTFSAKLAVTQSLILLQIMTLFLPTPNPSDRKQAEIRVSLLEKMIQVLYRSAPETLPPSMNHYQAWLLAESCRRTIHIAHMIHGVYTMLSRGTFTLTPFVGALPSDRNGYLWDSVDFNISSVGEVSMMGVSSPKSELISYRELIEMWDSGELRNPGEFERLLIIACKGIEEFEALSISS